VLRCCLILVATGDAVLKNRTVVLVILCDISQMFCLISSVYLLCGKLPAQLMLGMAGDRHRTEVG
jgi:hypothetical protein